MVIVVLHVHVYVQQMILIQYLTSCSTFHNAYVTYKGLFTRNVYICVCLKIQGMSSVATSDGVHTSSSHCNGNGISFITLVPFTSQMVIVAPNGGGHIAMTFLRPKLAVAATV